MILTINAIRNAAERQRFDQVVLPRLQTVAPTNFEVRHLLSDQPLGDPAAHSHLLISGSELSAARSNPRDAELIELIRGFVLAGKPVLGICYGHQMLARALAGDQVCQRAATPEFGWKRLRSVVTNPLFTDLDRIVTMHSHYDEVRALGDDFNVLAATAECAVQAFQYRQQPVWGVQFHPELGYDEGQRMLKSNLETEPLAPELAVDDLETPEQAEQNLMILKNFFDAQAARIAA